MRGCSVSHRIVFWTITLLSICADACWKLVVTNFGWMSGVLLAAGILNLVNACLYRHMSYVSFKTDKCMWNIIYHLLNRARFDPLIHAFLFITWFWLATILTPNGVLSRLCSLQVKFSAICSKSLNGPSHLPILSNGMPCKGVGSFSFKKRSIHLRKYSFLSTHVLCQFQAGR